MKRIIWLVLAVTVILTGCQVKAKAELGDDGENTLTIQIGKSDEVAPGFDENPYKDEVVAFVAEAVVEIETKGAEAFDEFRKEGSAWFEGERYVFVWGLDGYRFCYPIDPAGEGVNVSELEDPAGRPIGQMILDAAKSENGAGWVHYQWVNPTDDQTMWKSTYVQKAVGPDGTEYLAGSGLYKHPASEE